MGRGESLNSIEGLCSLLYIGIQLQCTSLQLWITHFQTKSYALVQWTVNLLVFKVNSKVYEKEVKELKKEGNRMVTF